MVQPKWPFKRLNVHMHSLLNGCFMVGAMKRYGLKLLYSTIFIIKNLYLFYCTKILIFAAYLKFKMT